MLRSIKVLIGCFGLVAVLTAAPIEYSSDDRSVGLNVAAAQPGNGKGHGNGRGHGNVAGQSNGAQGFADGQAERGRSNGQANGQAVGHANKDAVSGVGDTPPGQAKEDAYDGVKGNLGIQGSFNAIHSAAINKGVVAPQSRVARVEAYLDAAQDVSDIEKGEEGDLEAAIEAAAVAAASASSQTVTPEMLDKVHTYSNERNLTAPGIDMTDDTRDSVANQAKDN